MRGALSEANTWLAGCAYPKPFHLQGKAVAGDAKPQRGRGAVAAGQSEGLEDGAAFDP